MKHGRLILSSIFTCFTPLIMNAQQISWPSATPPVAEIKAHQRTVHNDTVNDPYYWMIDFFAKGPDSDRVVSYLEKENKYLDTLMKDTEAFQKSLYDEMKNRIKEKDESVPVFENGYYYYSRTEEGKQYFKYCRKKGSLSAPEEVLADIDELAMGHAFFSAGGFSVSPDNQLLAFAVDTVSRRQYDIYIKNLNTGEMLPDVIRSTNGNVAWANDSKTLFYTFNNPKTLLSEKIRKHKVGTGTTTDETVYEEKDKSNYIGVSRSKNNKFILIESAATLSSETFFTSADNADQPFTVFQPRLKDVIYEVIPWENSFLIRTNLDAKNFRLMECPVTQTTSGNWKEVIGHRPDVLIEGIDPFKGQVVISERKNGLMQFRVTNFKKDKDYNIDFGEAAYIARVGANPEYASTRLRYHFSSLTTPASVFDYELNTKQRELKKQEEIQGGYDPSTYISERIYVLATDGTRIAVSIVYKKGFEKNGNSPLLLYGYGSYGASIDPGFSSTRLSLLNRGFAYAIAHIRGGQEMGREWYEDGKMMKKKNTFTDFIDVGRFLIENKYTSPRHLYAQGGSAGGLLMGAVVNMAPELWHGVIAQVPFVDVVNTMLDESIPLTTNEFDEWGNPKNKEAYEYIKSYSPYENVESKEYPNLLVTTGLHDSQVQYFEPAKWVAKLRATKKGNNVVLLHTNMKYGHGGASGRFDYLKDIALNYAFLFKLEGINN